MAVQPAASFVLVRLTSRFLFSRSDDWPVKADSEPSSERRGVRDVQETKRLSDGMLVYLSESVGANAILLFRETVDFGRVTSEYDDVRGA